MIKEKYGFVYMWWDKKRNRYYIGCHWGTEDDGYICSSSWMKLNYKKHPEFFHPRRILSKIYTNKKDMFMEEQRWLNMIPNEQLGKKYYNLCKNAEYHWLGSSNENIILKKIGQKIREKRKNDPEYCERVRIRTIEGREKSKQENPERWIKLEEIRITKMKQAIQEPSVIEKRLAKFAKHRETFEYKQQRKELGQKLSNNLDFKLKMIEVMNRPDVKEKCAKSTKGKHWWNNGVNNFVSKECPGTGWVRGRIWSYVS